MTLHPRFNVFGRIVEVRREGALWQSYRVGADGKRTLGLCDPRLCRRT